MNYVFKFCFLFMVLNFLHCVGASKVSKKSFGYDNCYDDSDFPLINITITDSVIKNSKLLIVKVENVSTYDTLFVPVYWQCRTSITAEDFVSFFNPNYKEHKILNDTLKFSEGNGTYHRNHYFVRINPLQHREYRLDYLACEKDLKNYKDYQKNKKYLHKIKYEILLPFFSTEELDKPQYEKNRTCFYRDTVLINSMGHVKCLVMRDY
jgi:hypothetical protein